MDNQILGFIDLDITFDSLILSCDGKIIHTNKVFTEIFGYEEEEVIGKNFIPILFHEDDFQAVKEKVNDKNEFVYQAKTNTKSGNTQYNEIKGKTISVNGNEYQILMLRDIAEKIETEQKLKERIKELDAIYKLSKIVDDSTKSLATILKEIVNIIPQSFQYSDICEAQIEYNQEKYETTGFQDTHLMIIRELKIDNIDVGNIKVVYLPNENKKGTPNFLIEEEYLIDVFAERISKIIKRIIAETELRKNENYFRSLLQTTQDGFWVVNMKGKMIDVNDAYLKMSGYTREEFLALSINDIDARENQNETKARIENILRERILIFETQHVRKDGTIFDIEMSVSYSEVNDGMLICFGRDITEKKIIIKEKELTYNLLELLNTKTDMRELMGHVLDFMYKISDCEAVGIRLKDGDDYPYYETKGFSERFVKAEKYLCARDLHGQLLRDEVGNPILDCMCGNILQGRFDSTQPFFTEFGSFVSNGTTKLLSNTTEEDRQARTRNRCNAEGYESVMLIPLKVSNEVFGLLQFNDKRENRFSNSFIQLMERMAVDIAIALSQKNALRELEISERNLKESQKIAKLGSWHLDILSNKVRWTEELYDMYGFDPNLPPPPYTEHMKLFTPESWQILSSSLEKTRTEGIPYQLELETVRKDGSNGWMWVYGEAIKDFSGKIIELKGAAQDITDLKKKEEDLRKSEIKYRTLLNNLNAGVVVHRKDTSIEIANKRACELLGLTDKQIKGMEAIDPYWKFLREDGSTMPFEEYPVNLVISKQEVLKNYVAGIIRFENDNPHWVLVNGHHEKNEFGEIEKIVISFTEITELKIAEEKLIKSEQYNRILFDQSPIGLAVSSMDGRLVDVNKAFADILGRSIEEAKELNFWKITPEKYAEFDKQELALLNGKGAYGPYEKEYIHKDGHLVPVRLQGVIIERAGEKFIWSSIENITERRRTEQKLIESERQLASAASIARLGPWELDIDKGEFTFTDEFYAVFRTTADKEGGYKMSIEEYTNRFVYPEDSQLVSIENQKAIDTDDPNFSHQLDHRIIFNDGTIGFISVKYFVVKDGNGRTIKTFGVNQDITERKIAEQKIIDNEERLKGLEKIAHIGSYELDFINKKALWSDETFNIFELDTERDKEPTLEEYEKLVHEDDIIRLNELLARSIETGEQFNLIYRIKTAKGKIKYVHSIGNVFSDENGKALKMLGTFQDITERTQVEIELKKSEERYKNFISQVTEGVYRYELNKPMSIELPIEEQIDFLYDNLIIAECNGAFVEMYGAKDENDIIGKSQQELHGGKDNEVSRKAMSDFIDAGYQVKNILTEEVDSYGTKKYFNNNAIGIIEKNHLVRMWGTQTDITDRKKSEEALYQMQKLESIGSLAGGIAHDFNNLLSGIFGNIELARIKTKEEKAISYLDKTIESIERAQSLTNQLLTFAKGGKPNRKIEKINSLLKSTTEFALSGSNVICNYDIKDDLDNCFIDKNQIIQVIDNIIINSKQAMPGGGRISVIAKNVKIEKELNELLKEGNYVKIEIEDSGVGISKENLTQIFDPFFTTKPTGHGLGLSAVYSIISKHDGHIEVQSTVGEGTRFSIYLPAVEGNFEVQKIEKTKAHEGIGTFIIMDDDQAIRDSVGDILENFGYEVIKKDNGEEVLEFFKGELDAGRKVAGMIFDLTIPGALGGKETIIEIRKLCKKTKVYVSSGYTDSDIMASPEDYGFNGMLRKPFRIKDLIELLDVKLR